MGQKDKTKCHVGPLPAARTRTDHVASVSLLIVSPQKNGDKHVAGGPGLKNLPSPAAWLGMGESSSLHSGRQASDLSTLIKTDFGNVNGNLPSNIGDPGSIPGQRAKVPHTTEQRSLPPTTTETEHPNEEPPRGSD